MPGIRVGMQGIGGGDEGKKCGKVNMRIYKNIVLALCCGND